MNIIKEKRDGVGTNDVCGPFFGLNAKKFDLDVYDQITATA